MAPMMTVCSPLDRPEGHAPKLYTGGAMSPSAEKFDEANPDQLKNHKQLGNQCSM